MAAASPVVGDDWPAWRGDGSGVSRERDIVESWSESDNLCWKTRIPGDGISSPIVWGDRVFVTTARPGHERRLIQYVAGAAIWLLVAAMLWWSLDGVFLDPLNAGAAVSESGTIRTTIRKLVLGALFVAVMCGYLLLCRSAVARLAGTSDQGVEAEGYAASLSWLRRLPSSKFTWSLGGLTGAALVTFLNRWALKRQPGLRRLTEERGLARRAIDSVRGVFLFVVAASFLGVVIAQVGLVDYSLQGYESEWTQRTLIGAMGLIFAAASSHVRSPLRIVIVAVACAMMALYLSGPPEEPAGWLRRGGAASVRYSLYYGVTLAVLTWLALNYFRHRRRADMPARPLGVARHVGPLAGLFLVLVKFFAVDVIVPRTTLLREVVCLGRTTGQIIWQATCAARPPGTGHPENSPATPTPVTDGQLVFAHFGEAGTYAVDWDGRVVWSHDDPVPATRWGAASSPVLHGELLFVTHDTAERSFTRALHRKTGRLAWEADRPRRTGAEPYPLDAYSTPAVLDVGFGPHLVHYSNRCITGYDPATGAVLWFYPSDALEIVATPVAWKDLVILVGGNDPPVHMMAIRLVSRGRAIQPELAWKVTRRLPGICSPVVCGDYVFAVTDGGIATCRKAATGELMWEARLPPRYFASLIAADGRVYFCNLDGVTSVIEAGPRFRKLAVNTLNDAVRASFAVSNGRIFIRGRRHLYCIGPPATTSARRAAAANP